MTTNIFQVSDFPKELLLMVSSELDVKSLLLFSKINKRLYEFYSNELSTLLKSKLRILTKSNIDDYDLDHLFNIYRLLRADISYDMYHCLLLNSKGVGFYCNSFNDSDALFNISQIKPVIIPDINISKIFMAGDNYCLIDNNGILHILKFNDGQLEYGGVVTLDPDINKIKYLSYTYNTTLVISSDNQVYINDYCEWPLSKLLNTSFNKRRSKFEVVPNINNAINIEADDEYAFILTSDNILHYRRLGHDWCKINFNHKDIIIKISAYEFGIVLLTSGGRVLYLQSPFNREYKIINNLFNIIDFLVSNDYILLLDNNGKVYICQDMDILPIVISSLSNIIKIFVTRNNILALDYNGNIHTGIIYYRDINNVGWVGMCRIIPNINLL